MLNGLSGAVDNVSNQNDENLDMSMPNMVNLQLSTPVKAEPGEPTVGHFPPKSEAASELGRKRVLEEDQSSSAVSVTLRTESRSPSTMASFLSTMDNTPRTPTPVPAEPPMKLRRSSRVLTKQ